MRYSPALFIRIPGAGAISSCGTTARRCTAPAASTTATRSVTCAARRWPATCRRSSRRPRRKYDSMSDELPTAAQVADPGIRALYKQENRWQARLDVEVALARAQAELGIIPKEAAEAIARAARFELLDRARIDEGFARTGHTIVPLVWELGRVVDEPHGGWVHWGATTQNITQTGDLLVLRQAHRIFLRLIGDALLAAADLAEKGADMPIAGRTHGQHAVPATFGYKPAVWIDELIRHVERFKQAAPRLFVAMLGGGAGTFASLGVQGPAVQAGIAKELAMRPMTVPARTI